MFLNAHIQQSAVTISPRTWLRYSCIISVCSTAMSDDKLVTITSLPVLIAVGIVGSGESNFALRKRNDETSRINPTIPRKADPTTPCQCVNISVKLVAEQASSRIAMARFIEFGPSGFTNLVG